MSRLEKSRRGWVSVVRVVRVGEKSAFIHTACSSPSGASGASGPSGPPSP
ncbi:MAG: hypothetical protein F6K40_38065 [Okeania sp. SIO3I5]|nr:hypothetical protein [Okeania sp. SIO3I5]NEQ41685.1 hypothetical protein [Okeania sp. SIO3I5]